MSDKELVESQELTEADLLAIAGGRRKKRATQPLGESGTKDNGTKRGRTAGPPPGRRTPPPLPR